MGSAGSAEQVSLAVVIADQLDQVTGQLGIRLASICQSRLSPCSAGLIEELLESAERGFVFDVADLGQCIGDRVINRIELVWGVGYQ